MEGRERNGMRDRGENGLRGRGSIGLGGEGWRWGREGSGWGMDGTGLCRIKLLSSGPFESLEGFDVCTLHILDVRNSNHSLRLCVNQYPKQRNGKPSSLRGGSLKQGPKQRHDNGISEKYRKVQAKYKKV